jgi:hypothetical protein
MTFVWLFHGEGGKFASGVFSSRENAERWIQAHRLSGVLTRYPLDEGSYQWALANGTFTVKRAAQSSPEFIQRFADDHYIITLSTEKRSPNQKAWYPTRARAGERDWNGEIEAPAERRNYVPHARD